MKIEEIHGKVMVVITSDSPRDLVWQFRLADLSDSELLDLVSLIRMTVDAHRPPVES
jgi:hypothetical protein